MAKTGFWLKGANGKLAGATIYQSNGETIMREVVKGTDAKTTGQKRSFCSSFIVHFESKNIDH